jgi:hypothetical protein
MDRDTEAIIHKLEEALLGDIQYEPEPEDLPPPAPVKKKSGGNDEGADSSTDEEAIVQMAEDEGLAPSPVTRKGKKPVPPSGKKKAAAKPAAAGRKKGAASVAPQPPPNPLDPATIEAARLAEEELLNSPLQPLSEPGNPFETDLSETRRWTEDTVEMIRRVLLTHGVPNNNTPTVINRAIAVHCIQALRHTAVHLCRLQRRFEEFNRVMVSVMYSGQQMQRFGDRRGVTALNTLGNSQTVRK